MRTIDNTNEQSSPELMISGLNKRLVYLLKKIAVLEGDNDADTFEKDLRSILRKTFMFQLFNDKHIIAVSGLQGVGKSTLIKDLYGLSDDYFPTHLDRGEKLPILISEGDVEFPEKKVYRLSEGEVFNSDVIQRESCENFKETASEPDIKDILLELIVPYKYSRQIEWR